MSYHHDILAGTYYPLKWIKSMGRSLGISSKNRLRVLLHHDIAPEEQTRFAAQLRWLSRTWTFVTPEHFSAMVLGEAPIYGSNLLLTFDDGLASNRIVAEQVLNPMGIQALFFIVSDFVGIENREEARDFIAGHIYPNFQAEKLPMNWSNMNWNDLTALLEQGHSIGCHTRTHARLSQMNMELDLEKEIVSSADTLEKRLGVPIEHFSYPFGDLKSFSEPALKIAKQRFKFIHTGLRGDNTKGVSPFVLRRDSAAFQDAQYNYKIFSNRLLGAFLEDAAAFKYNKDLVVLDRWNSNH